MALIGPFADGKFIQRDDDWFIKLLLADHQRNVNWVERRLETICQQHERGDDDEATE